MWPFLLVGAAWADDETDEKLLEAVVAGKLGKVERLLKSGADANARDAQDETALHRAAEVSAELVSLLVANGADVHAVAGDRDTPLHVAANPEVVKALLDAGAEVNAFGGEDRLPLHEAVIREDTAVVQALLAAGAQVHVKDWDGKSSVDLAKGGVAELVSARAATQKTPEQLLRAAIPADDVPGAAEALRLESAPWLAGKEGSDLLRDLSPQGKLAMISLLVSAGAPANTRYNERTIADLARDEGFRGVAAMLDLMVEGSVLADRTQVHSKVFLALAAGRPLELEGFDADYVFATGNRALHLASMLDDVKAVRALADAGANINALGENARSPLDVARERAADELQKRGAVKVAEPSVAMLAAARRDDLNGVGAAIQLGADANWPAPLVDLEPDGLPQGATPLHVAAAYGHTNIARILLTAGADASRTDSEGGTPILYAARGGHTMMIDVLVKTGADPDLATTDGVTPLANAAAAGHPGATKQLLQLGAKAKPEMMEQAARTGVVDVVASLFAAGAPIDAPNPEHGGTALMAAVANGHLDLARYLLTAGANAQAADNEGTTPLVLACRYGHAWLALELLEGGAPATTEAATEAAALGQAGTLRMLAAWGARMPSVEAPAQGGHLDAVIALLDAGADPSAGMVPAEAIDDELLALVLQEYGGQGTFGADFAARVGALQQALQASNYTITASSEVLKLPWMTDDQRARLLLLSQNPPLSDLDAAVQFGPTLPSAWLSRAKKKIAEGDVDGAFLDLNKVLELDPLSAEAARQLALVADKRNDANLAARWRAQADRIEPPPKAP